MKKGITAVVIMFVFVVGLAFVQIDAAEVANNEGKPQAARVDKDSGKGEILAFNNIKEKLQTIKSASISSPAPQKQPVRQIQIASNSTPDLQASAPERKEQPQVSRGHTRILTMVATGYTEAPEENFPYAGQPSYIGIPLGRGVVAVDPNVIPMGTKLYVEGYGEAIAADQGGAIKGNRIDLFFDSKAEAHTWGMRTIKVYIR